jgi:hypothetical protein
VYCGPFYYFLDRISASTKSFKDDTPLTEAMYVIKQLEYNSFILTGADVLFLGSCSCVSFGSFLTIRQARQKVKLWTVLANPLHPSMFMKLLEIIRGFHTCEYVSGYVLIFSFG